MNREDALSNQDDIGAAAMGLTLVLGGAASGKSAYAERLVERIAARDGREKLYIATAEARDEEMKARIRRHRDRRRGWQTREAPHDLPHALAAAPPQAVVLVDCLTMWLTNRLLARADLPREAEVLEASLATRTAQGGETVLVSNEVGQGIVPDNALARRFRDAQGALNQELAALAGRVILVTAGLPLAIKGQLPEGI